MLAPTSGARFFGGLVLLEVLVFLELLAFLGLLGLLAFLGLLGLLDFLGLLAQPRSPLTSNV